MQTVHIPEHKRARALAALCNAAVTSLPLPDVTIPQAQARLDEGLYVDYWMSRCIKINFDCEKSALAAYDRDNGYHAASNALVRAEVVTKDAVEGE